MNMKKAAAESRNIGYSIRKPRPRNGGRERHATESKLSSIKIGSGGGGDTAQKVRRVMLRLFSYVHAYLQNVLLA